MTNIIVYNINLLWCHIWYYRNTYIYQGVQVPVQYGLRTMVTIMVTLYNDI